VSPIFEGVVKVGDVGETRTGLDKASLGLQYYPRQVAAAKMFGECVQGRKPTWQETTVRKNV